MRIALAILISLSATSAHAQDGNGTTLFNNWFGWVANAYDTIIEQLHTLFSAMWNELVLPVWNSFQAFLQVAYDAIRDLLKAIIQLPADVIDWVKVQIENIAEAVRQMAINTLSPMTGATTDEIAGVVDEIYNFGFFIDVYSIYAVVVIGFTVVIGILVAKVIWRTIPTIG